MSKFGGVTSTEVGYIGGRTNNPTYEQVCSGTTGHTEAVRVVFDRSKTTYKAILKRFIEAYSPYADISGVHGGQYKTAVFYLNAAQKKDVEEVLAATQKERNRKIFVNVEPAGVFWRAEDYHQHYYRKHGLGSCKL